VAYLTAKAGEPPNVSELRSRLQAKLPEYMVPAGFVPLDALPLTANGKVNRAALPNPEKMQFKSEVEFVAPRNPTEEIIAGVFARALGIERLGVHDNLFVIGGDSLIAIQIMDDLRKAFGVEISMAHLFNEPTVAGLGLVVEELIIDELLAGANPPFPNAAAAGS